MVRQILTRAAIAVPLALTLAASPSPARAATTEVTIRAVPDTEQETEWQEVETGSYGKTGGAGLAPVIALLGASSVGLMAVAVRYKRGEEEEPGE